MKILQVTPIAPQTSNAPEPEQAPVEIVSSPVEAPLDESAGLSDVVASLVEASLVVLEKGIKEDAEQIVTRLDNKGTGAWEYTDETLWNKLKKSITYRLFFKPTEKVKMVEAIGAEFPESHGIHGVVYIYVGYSQTFLSVKPEYQYRALSAFIGGEVLRNCLTHELTHAFEDDKRRDSGKSSGKEVPSIHDSKIDALSAVFRNAERFPVLNNIGKRLYLIDSSEINARVAEVAMLMRQTEDDSDTASLISAIKNTRVWKDIVFLNDFPAAEVYEALVEKAGGTEEGVVKALHSALQSGALGGKYGNSKTSTRLSKIFGYGAGGIQPKPLMEVLKGLEQLFKEKSQELKNRVFKTVSESPRKGGVEKPKLDAELDEETLVEAYPETFDMEEFRDLRNFSHRVAYCKERLKYLGKGSGRIVFEIDTEKVLKLAFNEKGVAQNEVEAQGYLQTAYGDYITMRFDGHPDDLWIEMEKATKCTPAKFKSYAGVSLDDFKAYVRSVVDPDRNPRFDYLEPNVKAVCDDSDFCTEISEMVGSMDMHPGDLSRASTWGIVHRNGRDMVVLADFGLTNTNHEEFYANKRTNRHSAYGDY